MGSSGLACLIVIFNIAEHARNTDSQSKNTLGGNERVDSRSVPGGHTQPYSRPAASRNFLADRFN